MFIKKDVVLPQNQEIFKNSLRVFWKGACFGLYVEIIYYDEELKLQISRRALDVTLGVLCPFCIGGFLTNK